MWKTALLVIVFFSVFNQWTQAQEITVQQRSYALLLKGLLAHSTPQIRAGELHGKGGNYHLLDAREDKEFEVSHLKKAKHVGYETFNPSALPIMNFSDTIIVYCSVGYRSEKIAEQLITEGYLHVYNLYGGIFEWKNNGYEVYSAGVVTDEVHAFSKLWGKWLKKGTKVYD